MAEIIAFKDLKRIADRCEVLTLFEQANAVAMRHHHGDPKVSAAIAEKCLELIQALELHAEPE